MGRILVADVRRPAACSGDAQSNRRRFAKRQGDRGRGLYRGAGLLLPGWEVQDYQSEESGRETGWGSRSLFGKCVSQKMPKSISKSAGRYSAKTMSAAARGLG